MAIEIKEVAIIDDNRNIVGANTYNGYVPVKPTLTITAANGMFGGGDLTTNRSLAVRAYDGISVNTSGVSVDATVVRTNGNQTLAGKIFSSNVSVNASLVFVSSNTTFANTVVSDSPSHAGIIIHNGNINSSTVRINTETGTLEANNIVGSGTGITAINANAISVGTIPDARLSANIPRITRNINAGIGLTGGGNLGADIGFGVVAGNSMSVNSSGVHFSGNTNDYMARSISTGSGLTGGGNLSSDRTLSVDASVVRTSGDQTLAGVKTFTSPIVAANANADSHVVTRIFGDGRYSQLARNTNEFGSDLNLVVESGFFRIFDDNVLNIPPNGGYGQMIVSKSGDSISQLVFCYQNGNGIWYRTGNGLTTSWQPWKRIIDDNYLDTALNLQNVVRDSYTINNGDGITGGGNLTTNRTISVVGGNSISVNSSGVHFSGNTHEYENRSISTGDGLLGGGDLSVDRTLTVNAKDGLVANTTGLYAVGGNSIVVDTSGIHFTGNTSLYEKRNINSGMGLSGGGDLSDDITIGVLAGDGIVVDSNGVHVSSGGNIIANSSGLFAPSSGAQGGDATNQVFWVNDSLITHDFTLPVGKNAFSTGPIKIANGVVVTIPVGSSWRIL